jgi:hypothetical protein
MRLGDSFIIAILLWIAPDPESVAQTPKPSPCPSIVVERKAAPNVCTPDQAQISAGDLYRLDGDYKNAEASYMRALQSTDAVVRMAALAGLRTALNEQHDWKMLIWASIRNYSEWLLKIAPLVIFLVLVWEIIGKVLKLIGKQLGRRKYVIEDLLPTDQGFADIFHSAYEMASLKARDKKNGFHGPLGEKPITSAIITPMVQHAVSDSDLVDLASLGGEKVRIFATRMLSNLHQPRLRLRVALRGTKDTKWVLVRLEEYSKILKIWSEPLGEAELLGPKCRLLAYIVAYVEKTLDRQSHEFKTQH